MARAPASASSDATRSRSAASTYCITIEWKTTVHAPGAGSASRRSSHSAAPERSTETGIDRATASAPSSTRSRSSWSGQR